MTLAITPLLPPLIPYLSGVLPPSILLASFQLFLQAAVSARIFIFDMGGLPRSCLFLRHLCFHFSFMQIHIIHLRIGRTSRFTSVSFESNHDFTILCNFHEVFSLPQNIGANIEGRMTTMGTDVVVFNMSCSVRLRSEERRTQLSC